MNNKPDLIDNEGINWSHLYNHYKMDVGKLLLHPVYQFIFIPARYKFIIGNKDGGKSWIAAYRVALKWLSNPNRMAVVFRKYAKDNARSTVRDVVKVFNMMSDFFKIPQLKPIEAENYKKNSLSVIKYTKTTPQYFLNTVTQQQIVFYGLEQLASGGLSWDKPEQTADIIWGDELVQLEEADQPNSFDDSSFAAWRIVESTVFRGTTNNEGKRMNGKNNPMKIDFSWVKEEVIFTNNAHNPDHWIMARFADYYVPLNANNTAECLIMEKEKIKTYYDPEYMGGEGLMVIRMTVLLNPQKIGDKLIAQIREDDFKEYSYLYLGATRQYGGLAYEGHLQYLHTRRIEEEEYQHLWPLSVGVDHALSADHKDWFAATFLATKTKSILIDGVRWYEPDFSMKIHYDEYGWHPKTMGARDDIYYAQELIKKLSFIVETIPTWKAKIEDFGFFFSVDFSAASFIQTLKNEILNFIMDNPDQVWWNQVKVFGCVGKNNKIEIDGTKLNARKGRVERNKRLLDYGMIWYDRFKCPLSLKGFLGTAYDSKSQEVIDKNRDFTDATDYAEMQPKIYYQFDHYAHRKTRIT